MAADIVYGKYYYDGKNGERVKFEVFVVCLGNQ